MKKYKAKLVKNEIDGRWRLFIPGIHDPVLQDVKVYPYLPIAESAGDLVSTAQTGCGHGSMMTNSDLFQLGQLSGNSGSTLISTIPTPPVPPPTPPISTSGSPGSDWDISQDPFWKFIFAGGGVGSVNGVGALSEMTILAEANPYEIRNAMMATDQTSPAAIDLSKVKHKLTTEVWVWVFLREDNEDEPIIVAKANTQFPKIAQSADGIPTSPDAIVQFPTVDGDNGLNFKDTFFNWNDTTLNQSRFVSFASNQYEQSHLVAPNSKLQGLTSSTMTTTNPNAQKHAGVVESTYGLESPKYHPVNTVYEFGMNTAIPINKHGWWAEDWLKSTSYFQMNANALWPRDRAFDLQVYPHGFPDSVIEAKLYEWQLDYSSDNRVDVSETKLNTPKPAGFAPAAYAVGQTIGSGFGFREGKMFNRRLTQNAGQSIGDFEIRNYLYPQSETKRYARKNSVLTITATSVSNEIFGYEITINGVAQTLAPIYVQGWATYTKNLYTDPNLIIEDKQLPAGMTAKAYAASIPGSSMATGSSAQVFYNGSRYEKSGRLSVLAAGIDKFKDLIIYTCYVTGHEIWWNNTDRIWLMGEISKTIFILGGDSISLNTSLTDGGQGSKIPNDEVWTKGFDRFSDWNIEVTVKLVGFSSRVDFYIESSDMFYTSGTKIDSPIIESMKDNPMNEWIASDMKGEVEGRLLNSTYAEDVFALTVESSTCGNWVRGGETTMQYGKTDQIISAAKNYDAQFPRMHIANLPADGSDTDIPITMYGLPTVKNSFTTPFNSAVDAFRNDGQMPIIMYKCPMSVLRYTRNSFPTTVVENDWAAVNGFSASTLPISNVICWKEVDSNGKSTLKGSPIISPSGQLFPQNLFNPAIHEKRTVELLKVSFNVKCSANSSKFDKLCAFDIYPFWRRGCNLLDYFLESSAFDPSGQSRNMGTASIPDAENISISADVPPTIWTCRVFFRQPKKVSKTGISDCVKGKLAPVHVETHSKRFKWDRALPIERQWLSFKFDNLNQTQRSFVIIKAYECEGDATLQVSGEETTVAFSDMGFPGIYGTETKQDLEWPRGKELTYIDYPKPLIRWWIDNIPLFEPRFLINEPEVFGVEGDGGATLKATQADYDFKSSLYIDNHYQLLQPPAQVNSVAHVNQMPWFIGNMKSSSKPTLIGGQELVLSTRQFNKQMGVTRMQAPLIVLNARRILIHQTDETHDRASITVEEPTFCNEGCDKTSISCCDACMIEPHWNMFVDKAFNIRLTERTNKSMALAGFLTNCFPEDVKSYHDNRTPDEDLWGKTLEWITPEYVTAMNVKLDALIENPTAVDTNTKKYQKKFYAWWNYYRQHTFKTTLMYGSTENQTGPRFYTESGNEWFPLDYDKYGTGRPFCHIPENLSLRGVDALFPKHIQLAFDWQVPGYSNDTERKQPYNYYPIGK